MTEKFVPYEQVLELKELEFDEPCFGNYADDNNHTLFTNSNKPGKTNAPTFSQVFRWFRTKYNFNCFVACSKIDNKWYYFRENLYDRSKDSEPELTPKFDTYEEAELACLKKLIEIVKKKEQ
jgi:hypothetical protein